MTMTAVDHSPLLDLAEVANNIRPPPLTEGRSDATPRKRARIACSSCHSRKVRCNIVQHGPPCWNCRQDGSKCIVPPPKVRGQMYSLKETTKKTATNTGSKIGYSSHDWLAPGQH
ncbi:hypothetical protein Z517_06085 [Fonsecaea pedrosoi CBS 271.37]|uniref:Unplaced genomic scaffold supercont1.4, whole genome shotgun sequence n=1 Tax=Fonsecaea pedrosoi CBS 271.37 TaxID=1442368 RepID=A0A0D2GF96_9EURO|nr:uncharacterized protein Z517_06085 [Fonsecaea pedrosoi CBS 271.37]KIW79473.1 hypothetical protein Z517_06085 [Fonsecaea pedrosoi CBS 271.37]